MFIRYYLQIDDLVRFSRHVNTHWPVLRRQLRKAAIVYPLIAAGFTLGLATALPEWTTEIVVAGIVLALGAIPLGRHLAVRSLDANARALYGEHFTQGITGHHRMELSDEGLIDTNEYARHIYFWHGIERLDETPDLLIVFVSGVSAEVIPKHAVAEGDLVAFSHALRRRLAERQLPSIQ